ncbi:hypothetical protein TRV_02370 [Trichophyton verrucosum HKI 0517]|uniref:RRM domain-containing protein n=1 Tax=Trichophyton verrucosum (strain HKI 0517) TaxID=663202 RepID=D4D5J8_TRIVH|nr:uncharacterized protein TRV_02370 [Trichophyton verrucosum HKI 0517]EFE42858.1 hypothetical protein TRV_02370 [Trichophyton verrucosum HKI 0517]
MNEWEKKKAKGPLSSPSLPFSPSHLNRNNKSVERKPDHVNGLKVLSQLFNFRLPSFSSPLASSSSFLPPNINNTTTSSSTTKTSLSLLSQETLSFNKQGRPPNPLAPQDLHHERSFLHPSLSRQSAPLDESCCVRLQDSEAEGEHGEYQHINKVTPTWNGGNNIQREKGPCHIPSILLNDTAVSPLYALSWFTTYEIIINLLRILVAYTADSKGHLFCLDILPPVNKQDIEEHFGSHGTGKITEIKLMQGFGFIEYEDAMDAKDVVPVPLFHLQSVERRRANTGIRLFARFLLSSFPYVIHSCFHSRVKKIET